MHHQRRLMASFWLVGLLAVSCKQESQVPVSPRSPDRSTRQQVYSVKGVGKEVKSAGKLVKIEHEKIPNYMDAMTMDFEVKDAKELSGVQPGDYVSFRMTVTDKDAWIDQISRIATNMPVANAPETFRRVRDVEPLNVGDPLPEYHFTNEINQAVTLNDFKGQAIGITFL